MSDPLRSGSAVIDACESCLRRATLIAQLADRIEVMTSRRRGRQARQILALDEVDLIEAVGLSRQTALERAEQAVAKLTSELRVDSWALCAHSSRYPSRLADLGAERPAVVFGRGGIELIESLKQAVTIVGARRASHYGRRVSFDLGFLLARAGLPVISGMASGVDGSAHRGALEAGGATVAVLGSGPDAAYPAGQRGTYERIVAVGAVISELPPGTRPHRWTFPARNRIMAALGSMTVVVEAATRSGSLITAEMAQELAREIGAVPGPVDTRLSAGPNALLADGALLVRGAADVLDAILGPGESKTPPPQSPELDPGLDRVLAAVERGCSTADQVSAATDGDAATVVTSLARLELLGRVACDSTGRFYPAGSLR